MVNSSIQFEVPVLFLIFNRPDTTQIVFNQIRKVQPQNLYVVADGPRKDRPDDQNDCEKARKIIQQVDWECKVSTLFRDENLGCKGSVSSGIDWFFSNVKEGIILEDDCVPDQSFFFFCRDLLKHYRHDERIMMISGDNFQFGKKSRMDKSYYFSRYVHVWGWASWQRAWKYYDADMKLWPLIREGGWLFDVLKDQNAVDYWRECFESTFSGKINTWDYQWLFACWIQNGLSILPNINLISNIGGGDSATHPSSDSTSLNIPCNQMKFPLNHPEFIIRDELADNFTQKYGYTRGRTKYWAFGKALSFFKNIWLC